MRDRERREIEGERGRGRESEGERERERGRESEGERGREGGAKIMCKIQSYHD